MNRLESELLPGSTVRAEFVGHHNRGRKALLLQQLAHQSHCRSRIAPSLNQEIQDFALIADRSPQIEAATADDGHHFIEMPAIRRLMSSLSEASSVDLAELEKPSAHGLVRDIHSAFGQKLFNITQAERETASAT